jgi:outer membrane receptor protein involved in Fe transport
VARRRQRSADDVFHTGDSLVSLTAFRALDYEWTADADVTELNLNQAHQHERQHQLSEEVTVSHRQSRLSWVGGMFLFDEFDHQPIWSDQFATRIEVRLDPRVDAVSRAAFGEATVAVTKRLSATGGVRYTHEGKDIDNAGGRYSLDDPSQAIPGSTYAYSDSITHSAWTPKAGVDLKLLRQDDGLRVGDARVQEWRLQYFLDGARSGLCARVGVEL